MKPVFVDTSAFFALLSADDHEHAAARAAFEKLRVLGAPLLTTSFVMVETYALVSRRLGLEAVRAFRETFPPLLEVVWVDEVLCERGLDLLLARGLRSLSLVDAVSFLVIRQRRLEQAFAFDAHFEQEGISSLRP